MSKLNKKLISDKLAAAAKMAIRSGDELLGMTVLNITSIYLYGRDDLLQIVCKSAFSALEIAKEERDFRKPHTPAGNIKGDKLDDALDRAIEYANLSGEEYLAGIISFAHAIRDVERADFMQQLYDVAEVLSSLAVGRKPRKDITIVENKDDAMPSSEEGMPQAKRHPINMQLEELAALARREGLPDLEGVLCNLRALLGYGHLAALKHAYIDTLGIVRAVEQSRARGETFRYDQPDDIVYEVLTASANTVALDGHDYVASILLSVMALHGTGRNDLMLQLAEIANSFSTKGLGNKPRKVILVFDNDIEQSISLDSGESS
ncbi:MAG TPA: hypothetical protein VJ866_02615 [Pyrinomonadaceae bacterium]|nr:hypothetical protein [Pyrinomonadaceae bacterium]